MSVDFKFSTMKLQVSDNLNTIESSVFQFFVSEFHHAKSRLIKPFWWCKWGLNQRRAFTHFPVRRIYLVQSFFFPNGKEGCWWFRCWCIEYMMKNFPLERSGIRLRNILYQLTVIWYVCINSTIIAGNIMNISAKHNISYVPCYF